MPTRAPILLNSEFVRLVSAPALAVFVARKMGNDGNEN
jgi:hypothetical protein